MLALQKALQMGFHPVFLTNNPNRYSGLESMNAEVIICNSNDISAIRDAIQDRVELSRVCGITTTSDFYVETVAALACIYGFPGNPPETLHICRNKALARFYLAEAGIKQPIFFPVRSMEEAKEALAQLGLPCIVKPADDSSSNNVKLCNSEGEALSLIAHILSITENTRGQPAAQTALLEQYVDAPEYSVEMFSYKGKTTCIGITEKRLTGFPFFVESRHIFPAPLAEDRQDEIIVTVQKALEIVGFLYGPSHTEIKLTGEGCSIIEINARLAGGMIPALISHCTGIDMLEMQIRLASHRSVDFDVEYHRFAGIQFIVSNTEGILHRIEGVEEVSQLPGIKHLVIGYKPGQRMRPPQNAYDRLGFIIAAANTYEETEQILEQALHRIKVFGEEA